jgi:replicative DNA helicase
MSNIKLAAEKIQLIEGELLMLAGRPAMGQTTLMVNMAIALSEHKKILFISLEKSKKQLANYFFNAYSDSFSFVKDKADKVLMVDEGFSIGEIEANIKNYCISQGVSIIFIDYLQLIEGERSELLKSLKTMALYYNVSIVVSTILSRSVELRENKRPVLSDLEPLFQNDLLLLNFTDKIIFLYRDSYYNIEKDNEVLELIVAKNRNGELSTVFLQN